MPEQTFNPEEQKIKDLQSQQEYSQNLEGPRLQRMFSALTLREPVLQPDGVTLSLREFRMQKYLRLNP